MMEKLLNSLSTPEPNFITYEVGDKTNIISHGDNADEVIAEAEKSGKEFIFSFVPEENNAYIF